MTYSFIRRSCGLSVSALLALGVLAACGKTDAPPAAAPAASPSSAASAPIAGIVPQAEDSAGSGVPGPGSGTTAVGGLAAGPQDRGGAAGNAGSAPAPTGGDGAASASSSTPK